MFAVEPNCGDLPVTRAGDVVREDAQLLAHVEAPHDVPVQGCEFDGGLARTGDGLALPLEGAVVAVGQAIGVEAHDFASVCDDVYAAIERGG